MSNSEEPKKVQVAGQTTETPDKSGEISDTDADKVSGGIIGPNTTTTPTAGGASWENNPLWVNTTRKIWE